MEGWIQIEHMQDECPIGEHGVQWGLVGSKLSAGRESKQYPKSEARSQMSDVCRRGGVHWTVGSHVEDVVE